MITSNQMKYLIALVDNNFIVSNAAIDLNVKVENVSTTLGRLINLAPDAFSYHEKPKHYRARVSGLTNKGFKLYQASRIICELVGE